MKILKFQATWCVPCKALSQSLAKVDLGLPMEELDIEEHPNKVTEYGVRSVPTLILVDDSGTEIDRIVGNVTVDKVLSFVANKV